MSELLFFAVCVATWTGFGWAMVTRAVALDRVWGGVRRLPLTAGPGRGRHLHRVLALLTFTTGEG